MSPEQAGPPDSAPTVPSNYDPPAYERQSYQRTTYERPAYQPPRMSSTERVCQIVYLVFGVIEVLIAIRFLLKLLAANPDAGFSSFMYGITEPFVAFFQGVFPTPVSRGSVLELSSVLAIIVYALLAYIIVRVIRIAARRQTPDAL